MSMLKDRKVDCLRDPKNLMCENFTEGKERNGIIFVQIFMSESM